MYAAMMTSSSRSQIPQIIPNSNREIRFRLVGMWKTHVHWICMLLNQSRLSMEFPMLSGNLSKNEEI